MRPTFRSLVLVFSLVAGLAWLSDAQVSIERGNTFGPLLAESVCIDADTQDICLNSDDDGALTISANGNGFDEDLTLNLDDTTNTIVASSSTGVTQLTWTEIVQAVTRAAIAVTSTDGGLLANNTASTAGVPVQQSPRLRFRSNVWNTTAVAANNTDDWWMEAVPASAATPSSRLYFQRSLNGAAAITPLMLESTGSVTILGTAASPVFSYVGGSLQLVSGQTISSPAVRQVKLARDATFGVLFDFATANTLKIRDQTDVADLTVNALSYLASQSSITAGAHATVVNTGEIRTVVYKATVTSTTCLAPFAAAATTADCTVATLPAKTKITAVYADTTAGWTCSGTCTGTKVMVLGKSAGGTEYHASNTVATSPVTRGLADAELGTELVRAARIQDGAIIANAGGVWTGTTTVTARFTSGTGNWGDAATTFVNAGSTTFYIETTVYP